MGQAGRNCFSRAGDDFVVGFPYPALCIAMSFSAFNMLISLEPFAFRRVRNHSFASPAMRPVFWLEGACGWTGRVHNWEASRLAFYVTSRGIRPRTNRKISWPGHDVGK